VCIVPPARAGATFVLGRGHSTPADAHPRLDFARNRGGAFEPRPPLASRKLSRVQLAVTPEGTRSLAVRNVGRCRLEHNGVQVDSASVGPGDTLQLGQELLLLCVRREAWLRSSDGQPPATAFAQPDGNGLVGESPAAWELRARIAFAAPRPDHVLIVGESGTGKELVARALHALSGRGAMAFVARNAATFPESLIDAELFGHARNYPSAGMPERLGLVGQAAGGTLFLDELAELPASLQTHLLRVLDAGEYQRLGDGTPRVSNFRLLAATNRPERLRPDLAARLKLTVPIPGLNDRLEDIPLLLVHLLRRIAGSNSDLKSRLFPSGGVDAEPRLPLTLVNTLLRHHYTTHVRELEALTWEALASTTGQPTARSLNAPSSTASREQVPGITARPKDISATAIEAALVANEGSLERTWRALALSSRHALTRLMAKHGLRRPSGQR
jgi:DNA-binding NtrC family response regulator